MADDIFIAGIGGMGAAPLAIYLAQAGAKVSGWDDGIRSDVTVHLQRNKIACDQKSIPESATCFVYSSAIAPTHPLYIEAKQRQLPMLRRGEMLAKVAADKKLIAVVGSHGKTTTCGMLIHLLRQSGTNFSYVMGGLFRSGLSPAAYDAGSDWLIAEVDESDGTIEHFSPAITLALNWDWDHPDQYDCAEKSEQAFQALFTRTNKTVLFPAQDETLSALAQTVLCAKKTFERRGNSVSQNNETAAMLAAREIAGTAVPESLRDFEGIARRQDILYAQKQLTVVADYAHHPTELDALHKWVCDTYPKRTVTLIFQPHRYTRTKQYAKEFATAIARWNAQVYLMPVYAASEKPLADGQTETIVDCSDGAVEGIYSREELLEKLSQQEFDNALILFAGAGDIEEVAAAFVQSIQANDWFGQVAGQLSSDSRCLRNEPLYNKTTMRVGGRAAYYAEPANEPDVLKLWKAATDADVPTAFLGRGSNVLVPPQGYNGLVIRLHGDHWRSLKIREDGLLYAAAGVRLRDLCLFACKEGLEGFEFLEGIPGTVGGALRMNAGAMGGWIFDLVQSVRYASAQGQVLEVSAEKLTTGYRHCSELLDTVALGAVFHSSPSQNGSTAIRGQIDTYAQKRKESQPRLASAGCVFKNPDQQHSGKLIDEAGLKGLRIGGAEVSTVHANFIVNNGDATAADVLALVRKVRSSVHEKTGVWLEPEVQLLGETWEDVL